MDLFPHQRKAVDELHNGAVLWGDVGTGKSLTALAYYVENESPRDLIIITTAKKRDSLDWERDAARLGIGRDRESTLHGLLVVDSWNNVAKYVDRKDAFFIFDEQRIVGSGNWVKSFISIAKENRWILCSATPGDTWLDYIPVFIANGYFKNRTEFLRAHVVFNRFSRFPKVERYTGVGTLVRLKNKTLVEMPYLRHTTRKTEIVEVQHDAIKFDKVLKDRWNVFLEKPLRDVGEMFLVLRKVVNSDTSRLEAVRQLLSVHPKLIVFYNFDFELQALRSLAESSKTSSEKSSQTGSGSGCVEGVTESEQDSVVLAEWNGHKHEPIPTSDRWLYLVQYAAGSEGWNCTETDAMVFYSLTYSYKMWHQAHGRTDRLNTPFNTLYYYVLMSNSVIDKAIWRSLMGKKSFNESRFLKQISDTPSQEVA